MDYPVTLSLSCHAVLDVTLALTVCKAVLPHGTTTAQLAIEGMHCASCVVTIEEALKQTPGVLKAAVNPATQQAHVEYLPGPIDRKGLARSIEDD